MRGLIVDLFAGGGGASTGLERALGRPVDLAINHARCHQPPAKTAICARISDGKRDPARKGQIFNIWPEPTHGAGRLQPWRRAAEIIDWSLPRMIRCSENKRTFKGIFSTAA